MKGSVPIAMLKGCLWDYDACLQEPAIRMIRIDCDNLTRSDRMRSIFLEKNGVKTVFVSSIGIQGTHDTTCCVREKLEIRDNDKIDSKIRSNRARNLPKRIIKLRDDDVLYIQHVAA
jgi:hypothetical protein